MNLANQAVLYIGCLLLPPLGFWWGYKYIKQEDSKSKTIGMIAIVLTIISLIGVFVVTKNVIDKVNKQLNSSSFMGF